MARIVFDLPAHFVFSTEMQIYISHVNQGGHLDNAQLLSLVSEARVRFFQAQGYPEADVGGLAIVVGDIVAQYKSEGFDLVFRMTEKSQGREVARGKTGIVFINKSDRKVALLPAHIRALLSRPPVSAAQP